MQPQSVQMRSRQRQGREVGEWEGRERLMRYSLEGKEEGTGARNQDARQVEDTRVRCGH